MTRAAALLLLLAGCAAAPEATIYRERDRTTPHALAPRPHYPSYGASVGRQPIPWSAESLAGDFEELLFVAEWGEETDHLLRFEGPVRVALAGPELRAYRPYLEDLVARISAAAPGLDLAVAPGERGEITLRPAPPEEMDKVAPEALCFFIPFDGTWSEFRAAEARGETFWDGLDQYRAITVFLPRYAAPHEIRSCIEEEVTQALGPANDILRLEDSIFNDDNAQGKATAFDLLMLRVLYDPSLHSGMSRAEAKAAALRVLSGAGTGRARRAPSRADRVYADLTARADSAPRPAEQALWVGRAIEMAADFGPVDHRLPAAVLEAGHIAYFDRREGDAAALLRRAEALLLQRLGPDALRLAGVRGDLGAILLRLGDPAGALAALDAAVPVLAANADDWRLAHALRWRALALAETGRAAEAKAEAARAVEWAAWVYGADSRAARAWASDFAEIGLSAG